MLRNLHIKLSFAAILAAIGTVFHRVYPAVAPAVKQIAQDALLSGFQAILNGIQRRQPVKADLSAAGVAVVQSAKTDANAVLDAVRPLLVATVDKWATEMTQKAAVYSWSTIREVLTQMIHSTLLLSTKTTNPALLAAIDGAVNAIPMTDALLESVTTEKIEMLRAHLVERINAARV